MPVCAQASSDGDFASLPPLMPAMQSALGVFEGLFDPALQLSKQVRAYMMIQERLSPAVSSQPHDTVQSSMCRHEPDPQSASAMLFGRVLCRANPDHTVVRPRFTLGLATVDVLSLCQLRVHAGPSNVESHTSSLLTFPR